MISNVYKQAATFLLIMCCVKCWGLVKSDDYHSDPVLDYLLNEDSVELMELNNDDGFITDDEQPKKLKDVWMCGKCKDIDESKLIYSELNDIESDMNGEPVIVQISLALDDMQCIIVKTDDESAEIQKVVGSCTGTAVTLAVSSISHFNVSVYD